ncbi:MAG: hypothetical protein V4580_08660 [Bacteroidota bacterium]
MKTKTLSAFFLLGILSITSSCHKTYACKCSDARGTNTYTTGQVKAVSKARAEKRCAGSCNGGTVSVK